jgi:regulator of cell morphogenesis and NO signaling
MLPVINGSGPEPQARENPMLHITRETPIAEVAAQNPATIRVFQRLEVDFCCGGKRPLGEICAERHVTFGELRAALEAAGAPRESDLPGADVPLGELIRFIVDTYHAELREELPRLDQMMAKVLAAHGARHPEVLPAAAATLRGLREELESHMMKEERVLFPAIESLAAQQAGRPGAGFPPGAIRGPIGTMEHEHDDVAQALARLRELTAGYTLPDGACNTFRGLYHGLAALERRLHEHIHLENNVLFPRAARLAEELAQALPV